MSDNQFDNSDWQLGMPLPSRKETHKKKKKSKATVAAPVPAAPPPPRDPEDRASQREPMPEPEPSQSAVGQDAALSERAKALAETAAAAAVLGGLTAEERELLWGEEEDEDGPIFTVWQRILLFVLVPLMILFVLLWGKIAYVHDIPQLVRDNVPAYASGEGFLVVKPWWFGPPVYALDAYPQANDFPMYQTRMGDHAELVEDPFVLWSFQEDILSN